MADRHVSIPKPFSSGDVAGRFQHFEICSRANGWNDAAKVLKLPTLLEGEALAIWHELSVEEQEDYARAKEGIEKTMTPMEFVSLDYFHRRKLHPGEALSVFVLAMKRLLVQAMPSLDSPARDQLLLHQFLAGLPDGLGWQLRSTGEMKSLDAAIARARLLMTIEDHGQVSAVSNKTSEVELLQEQVVFLTEQVGTLMTSHSATGVTNTTSCVVSAAISLGMFSVPVPTVTIIRSVDALCVISWDT